MSYNQQLGRQADGARTVLQQIVPVLREECAGLITDIDGTISAIAPSPELARVSPACRRHLKALVSQLTLVAAVSGRSAAEARALVGVDGLVYVGNHGLEMWTDDGVLVHPQARGYRPQIAAAVDELRSRCGELPGVIVEDKGVTASIHYRLAERGAEVRGLILEAVGKSPSAAGLWVTEGKMVVELRPPLAMDKGVAVCNLVDRYALRGVVYLGDDLTDLDAFNALAGLRKRGLCQCLSLAVAGPGMAEEVRRGADFCLDGLGEVERILGKLATSLR